jgi:hypothetical protein
MTKVVATLLVFGALAALGCGDAGTSSAGSGASGGATSQGSTGAHTSTSGTSGTSATGADPCAGVTCDGHGTCASASGQATCSCDNGYHSTGADCAVDETCANKQCGNCASCEVMNGVATCTCPDGYTLQGSDCVLATDPCATANCTSDEVCVPEAHCQPLGACVAKCDCSNCPNCAPDNSDGRWNDEQEYCGAQPNQQPATMACNKPCPSGEGCLPYATQFCWPIEGCFSL